ncbi:YwiC-like protein [Bifidobacterium leontopitheci]|uniref:YwiC-like protein n=2 Tax=Bifidobacterium leontopitheci TaxID=2650774 RepID=A0A6I1GWP2_9BIFI|nr:YwiC-like protein [Bifidobacterium leontopitheci]
MMALAPALMGVCAAWRLTGRTNGVAWWALACWALCYCVEFTGGRWLKSHLRRRFAWPVVGYGVALAAVGVPFVWLHPKVLVWAPAFLMFAVADGMASWLRQERSLWADAVAVMAACLMPMVTFGYGVDPYVTPLVTLYGFAIVVSYAAVEFGSVLFVKTMIREHGRWAYVVASWLWHGAALAWWVRSGNMWLMALGIALLLRTIVLPLAFRVRRPKPIVAGATESVASLLAFVCILMSLA